MGVEKSGWEGMTLDRIRETAEAALDDEHVAMSEAAERAARELRGAPASPARIALAALSLDAVLIGLAVFATAAATGGGASALTACALAALVSGGLGASGAYRLNALACGWASWARASAALGGALAAAGLVGALGGAPASVAGWSWVVGAALLAASRIGWRGAARWLLSTGATERRAVIVGGGGNAEALIRGLDARSPRDVRIVGMFDDRGSDRSPEQVAGVRKLGSIDELVAFARHAEVDMLIVTLPLSAEQRILSLLKRLWVLPIDVRLSAYSAGYEFADRRDGGAQLIDVIRRPLDGAHMALKRALDVCVASIALVAVMPVMVATAIAIRLETPGPALFRQNRHGYNHRPVEIWKFRSMRVEEADPTARKVVTRGDSRVTRVGRIIRKTSIDELPQLFNVLSGELSLVGPRPHVLDAVSSRSETFAEIVEGYAGRHRVKPGVTGWAQINGWRGEIDDPEKLRRRFEHDIYYIENWSLWLDLKILARTPFALLNTENAY